jgi:hypothetical protein
MKHILIFIIFLFIIAIIFTKLYFSHYEQFTVASTPACSNNISSTELFEIYKTTGNLNNILKDAKTNAIALPENQNIATLFKEIPDQITEMINKKNIYSNLLITNSLNQQELDNNFDNFIKSTRIFNNKFNDLYTNIINYNSNTIKQNYDNAITNFQSSYNNYNNKLDLYKKCILTSSS